MITTFKFALIIVYLSLAGCIGADDKFGKTWIGAGAINAGGTISLPPNAPSMSNMYYEASDQYASTTGEEHLGIDIIATLGTPVIAPANGRIVKVFTEPFYGNNIIIDHGFDATGRPVHTQYKHLQSQMVRVGDVVARGQQIGTLGRTGLLSGGLLHLHFEVQLEGRFARMEPVNPHSYWIDGIGMVTCYESSATYADSPFKITYPVVCLDN